MALRATRHNEVLESYRGHTIAFSQDRVDDEWDVFVKPGKHDDFDTFFKNVKNPKVEFVNLHVYTDGKLGFARSIQHFTGTSNEGKPMDMIFRVTDCLHKVKGKWKILHTHVSFPVDLATGQADFQAKP